MTATGAHACPVARGSDIAPFAGLANGAVRLEDGVRLVPSGAVIPTRLTSGELAAAAEAAGRSLIGRTISVARSEEDRHGRLAGPAALAGTARQDLAVALVAAGAAYADPASRPPCAEALLWAERQARMERRGIWAVEDALLPTAQGAAARERIGLFAVAQGRVASVNRAARTLYVNFSGPRKQALVAVATGKSNDGLDPAMLTGTVIRVRGMVNGDAGPRIAFGAHGLEGAVLEREESAR